MDVSVHAFFIDERFIYFMHNPAIYAFNVGRYKQVKNILQHVTYDRQNMKKSEGLKGYKIRKLVIAKFGPQNIKRKLHDRPIFELFTW